MSLLGSNQVLTIRLPERITRQQGEYTGKLLFLRDQEIVVRLVDGPGLTQLTQQITRAAVQGTGSQAEYRQGNYLCSFQGKFELAADRSLPVSLLMIMPMPGTIRRVLDPV